MVTSLAKGNDVPSLTKTNHSTWEGRLRHLCAVASNDWKAFEHLRPGFERITSGLLCTVSACRPRCAQ